MNRNPQVLLIYPPSNRNYGLFSDLEKDERVAIRCAAARQSRSPFLSFIKRIIFSNRLNRLCRIPMKEKWFEYHDIYTLLPNLQYILVIDLALNCSSLLETLENCRKMKPSVRICLYYINTIDSAIGNSREKLRTAVETANTFHWNKVFSFDPVEARKYNMLYWGFNYYSKQAVVQNHSSQYDLYCIALASVDRESLLLSIYNHLTTAGVLCDFYLKDLPVEKRVIAGVNYINKGNNRPYESVLQDLQNSKCILEVLRDNQKGPSLRYFEAVCYNKKLLTNNEAIKDFPYYNEKYMRVFQKVEDIEIEWLKNEDAVDYHYKGDFSPIKMIDFLMSHID